MKLRIDKETDALYLRLDKAKVIESEQVAPGIIVDFDGKNNVVGVEVLNVSKRASVVNYRGRCVGDEVAAFSETTETPSFDFAQFDSTNRKQGRRGRGVGGEVRGGGLRVRAQHYFTW